MTYSQQDILIRIKATLPSRWFGESTPILDLVLGSLAAGWVSLFNLLNFVRAQSRIGTATGIWLDLVAQDYFGRRLQRRLRESDGLFRKRILFDLLRDRCTRAAVYDILLELTGRSPIIFEPTNPQDTGCYGSSGSAERGRAAYCTSGGWGNLNLPFQAFVRAYRPQSASVAMINGWGGGIGGFGAGSSAYISSETDLSRADDSELYESVARTAPAGTIIWMSIES
jgi:hypothetical protein